MGQKVKVEAIPESLNIRFEQARAERAQLRADIAVLKVEVADLKAGATNLKSDTTAILNIVNQLLDK